MSRQVGFIGLGTLGFPICRNLARSGVAVRAFDAHPRPERIVELRAAGAQVVSSLAEVAEGCDLVITVLPDSDAVESVLRDSAFLGRLTRGTVCIEMSSGLPATTIRIGTTLAEQGVALLDAPICNGGVSGAVERRSTLCVGGDVAVVEQVRPTLELVAGTVIHVGPLGAGHAMKIVNNSIALAFNAVIAEGLALGVAYGFDLQQLVATLGQCSVSNANFTRSAERCVRAPTGDVMFQLYLGAKDLRHSTALAGSLGIPHLVTDVAHGLFEAAQRVVGPRAESDTAPYRLLEHLAALERPGLASVPHP